MTASITAQASASREIPPLPVAGRRSKDGHHPDHQGVQILAAYQPWSAVVVKTALPKILKDLRRNRIGICSVFFASLTLGKQNVGGSLVAVVYQIHFKILLGVFHSFHISFGQKYLECILRSLTDHIATRDVETSRFASATNAEASL